MEISAQNDATTGTSWLPHLVVKVLDETFGVVDGRVKELAWFLPSTIQIDSKKTNSVITVNHTIRVEHWNDFDNELVSDFNSLWVVR